MATRTLFAALYVPGPNDPTSANGNAFFSENPGVIDQFLRIGAVAHRHDAHPPLSNPTAPVGASVTTGGQLDGDTNYYLCWTTVDADGGETAKSPTTTLTMGTGIGAPPTAPTTTVDPTQGILTAGDYYYAKTWTDGLGGETPLSPSTNVYVDPGFSSASVLVGDLRDGAPDTVVSTRVWRSYQGSDWRLAIETSSATWLDTGFDPPDNPAQPPSNDDTLGATGAILLTVPSPSAASSAQVAVLGVNLYLSTDPGFPDPSFYTFYPVASAGANDTIIVNSTQQGEPPAQSRASRGAALIDPDHDLLDYPWKRPVATFADLPIDGSENGDMRITLDDFVLNAFVSSASTWLPGGGAVGSAGPEGPEGPDGPAGPAASSQVTSDPVTGSYTLALTDAGNVVEMTGDTDDSTLTIPANADVPFPVGTVLEVCDVGATTPIDIVGADGVNVDLPPGAIATSTGQWATIGVRQRATDEWILSGRGLST